ncbi:MAG: class I SAM-dependent methyltransferase [Bacteroidetes bacterium]|nr:class I SAM-dependent methyltransferase [Bacteroidota bacterium]
MKEKDPGNTEKVDFDNFAGRYENILDKQLDFFGEENSYFAEYKIKITKETLGFVPENILEFGCGIGRNLKYFTEYFPGSKVNGCDISEKSLSIAAKENPSANIFLINKNEIGRYGEKFDLIFISCVFHHIKPSERIDSVRSVFSMLKKNGAVYIFEHNPYNPVTRHIVNTCPWDTDAILLNMKESVKLLQTAGLEISKKNYSLFFPASLKFLRFFENYLGKVPLGGQYYVKAVRKI